MRGLFEERLTRNDVGSAVRTTGVIICPSDEWSAQRTLLGNPQIQELRGTRTMGNALRSGGLSDVVGVQDGLKRNHQGIPFNRILWRGTGMRQGRGFGEVV